MLAVPDVKVAAENADVLVWVLPHQFVGRTAAGIKDVRPRGPGASWAETDRPLDVWECALASHRIAAPFVRCR